MPMFLGALRLGELPVEKGPMKAALSGNDTAEHLK